VEEARNHVAVKRGPVVYCLESPDLPDDVRVDEAVAPADVEFTVRRDRELLGGVAVLEAQLAVRPAGDWDGVLYRPRTRAESRLVRTQLIPYYAWSNRGDSEMTVWIPAE
ncbi:MAG TPA: glycoside hydrolase family 127 protein, partial [Lacipirellulaceae bacterium]|nr:glycoside hydrolase family 127 protein [Lacipirellulaceae bacterium]